LIGKISKIYTSNLFFLIFISLSCNRFPKFDPVEKSIILMDTFVSIRVYDEDKDEKIIKKAIDNACEKMEKFEHQSSTFEDSSQVALINRYANKRTVALNEQIRDVIQTAQDFSYQTEGAFDITIAPLLRLWGFGYLDENELSVPDEDQINKLVNSGDYRDIQLTPEGIRFNTDLSIDLGGIAKGYAVDLAITELEKEGITDAIVDAGGDLRTLCGALTKGKRNVYIRHPRKKESFIARFPIDQKAVATSGDYERYFIENTVRYHHILDPRTGYPARGTVSVTVIGPTCTLCDVSSTAIFVLGPEDGIKLVENDRSIEGIIFYEQDGKLQYVVSSGLEKLIEEL
jgi:thiamine biosynthesis lipoprotein